MVIEYRFTNDDDRGAYATHQINAGSCLLIEEPFADVTTLNCCANCFKVINRNALLSWRKPCLKCNQVMYCNKKCKVAHEGVHESYCAAYKMSSACHRRLSKAQEHLAILAAQCLSRVLMEAEDEGICGIHAIQGKDFQHELQPDRWIYDDLIGKLIYVSNAPPIDPSAFPLEPMMARATDSSLRLESSKNIKEFLTLMRVCSGQSVSPVDGWSAESLDACLTISDSLVRRWLCTCASSWSDRPEEKLKIVTIIMRVVLNYGIFTEVHWPNEYISTQIPEILPTSFTNPVTTQIEAAPLDRRKSGVIGEHMARACDAYLPSIAAFNKAGSYGIWPKVALLTHSCEPNCYVYWYKNRAVAVTLRKIDPGERLTIAKCSLLLPYPARKLILESRYGFTCHCLRCVSRGQITIQDVDSITRDLAPVIPDEGIINGLIQDANSYLNIDAGLCATRQQQQLYDFQDISALSVGRGGPSTPETAAAEEERPLNFDIRKPTMKLPVQRSNPTPSHSEVLLANCEIALLNNLRGTLKHQTSANSYTALCNITSITLEGRLNPLSLYLYELRKEMDLRDWRVAAKQLVFLSFIYRRCESHLERIEELERLGLLIKRDYYSKWRTIVKRKSPAGAPPAKVNYAATNSASAEIGSNQLRVSRESSGPRPACAGAVPAVRDTSAFLLLPSAEMDREVIAEALRCIFREVQFGYQNLFGAEFSRTKLATSILADLTK